MIRRVFFFSALAILITILSRGQKHEADEKMREFCAKDGGVKVYETVSVPKRQFDKFGRPRGENWNGLDFPSKLDPDYEISTTVEFLKRGDPIRGEVKLTKIRQRIVRVADKKVMAESVTFGRSGGDSTIHRLLGLHPSGVICPETKTSLVAAVFIRE